MNQEMKEKNIEMDLKELLTTIWQGKWLVFFSITVFFVVGLIYVLFFQTKKASFFIQPISSFEVEKYTELNGFEFFDIDRNWLVNLLTERLSDRIDFIDAVKKTNYIKRESYNSDIEWEEAIIEFVYKLELNKPTINQEQTNIKDSSKLTEYWELVVYGVRDEEKLKFLLDTAIKSAGEEARVALERRYKTKINLLVKNRKYGLEDIERTIKNVKNDYDVKIAERLAFLQEQAQIARSVGIAKNTIEAQSISAGASIVATTQSETPFYLRGYEAIEKEIALVEQRENKDLFISSLIELEQQKRDILQNPLIERVQLAFNESPVSKKEDFKSAKIDLNEIRYETKISSVLLLIISLMVGFIIGVMLSILKRIYKS